MYPILNITSHLCDLKIIHFRNWKRLSQEKLEGKRAWCSQIFRENNVLVKQVQRWMLLKNTYFWTYVISWIILQIFWELFSSEIKPILERHYTLNESVEVFCYHSVIFFQYLQKELASEGLLHWINSVFKKVLG